MTELEYYEAALRDWKVPGKWYYGFCHYFMCKHDLALFDLNYSDDMDEPFRRILPTLYSLKPNNVDGFWFEPYHKTERIKLLKQAIQILKDNEKTNNSITDIV